MNLVEALNVIVSGANIERTKMQDVMRIIMSGAATQAQIGALLAAISVRGEAISELLGAATVMREFVLKVPAKSEPLLDTCGTGGSGMNLFNISTVASFVAAAGGVHVSKHGNRGMSSKSGSADLLEAAGVILELTPAEVGRCIDEIGIGFMFAQAHHLAMKHVAPVRRELGIHTLFNLMGPMTNPAGARRQLIGVPNSGWQMPMTRVLQTLGSEAVLLVHCNGLDELGLMAPSAVVELKNGEITSYQITPEEVGLKTQSHESLRVKSSAESLAIVRRVLSGKASPGTDPATDIVALNAGAALYVAKVTTSIALGVELAQDLIASGLARERLAQFAHFTQTIVNTRSASE